MSGQGKAPDNFLDSIWSSTVEGFAWLKSVLLGEFEDNRPLSAIVADMLVSFVPGVVIVTSARDAVAVILRLAQHPEKREELMEWVLLSACLIALAVPIVMAAGGAVFAGIGAVVGGIAGSELGAILRGVMLMLIKKSGKLVEMIQFLQKFIRGDIVRFLRAIRFVEYEKALLTVLNKTIDKLVQICRGLRKKLEMVKYFAEAQAAIAKLAAWEHKFYAVQAQAVKKIPLAMAELQTRLARLLAEAAPKESHVVSSGVAAQRPATAPVTVQRVQDVAGRPLSAATPGANGAATGAGAGAGTGTGKAAGTGTGAPKPPLQQTPAKVDKVAEPPNTKRQDTFDPDVKYKAAGAFNYPRDLDKRVAEEAQRMLKSGEKMVSPAIARVGSHKLGLESPSFLNFTVKEAGAKVPNFPGVFVEVRGGDFFEIRDVELYMATLTKVYEKTGEVMHPRTRAAIRARIANRAKLPMIDGLPGAHAEVRAQNWFYNKTGGAADAETVAVTYRLTGKAAGEKFVACTNCSRIIPSVVNVVTGRRF